MSKSVESLAEKYQAIASQLGKSIEEVTEMFNAADIGVQSLADIQILEPGDIRNAIGCDGPAEQRPSKAQWRHVLSIIARKVAPANDTDVPSDRLDALQAETGVELKLGIKDLSVEQLVPYFDPTNPSDRITRELKTRFGNNSVLVFDPGTKTLNVAQTLVAMKRVERGADPLKTILVNGSLVRTIPVGELPDQFVDEDPFFPGQALENGVSIGNFIDWSKVPLVCRQFCRHLHDHGTINPLDEARVAELQKTLDHGLTALTSIYKVAAMEFNEREASGDLPKLKIPLNKKNKTNYPFGSNRSS